MINYKTARKFGSLELLAKQVVEGFITGLHQSPFHGFSVEFAEHRLYNSGESVKHLDWKLLARTEKLFIKTLSLRKMRDWHRDIRCYQEGGRFSLVFSKTCYSV